VKPTVDVGGVARHLARKITDEADSHVANILNRDEALFGRARAGCVDQIIKVIDA
jgi:hypothetical protein